MCASAEKQVKQMRGMIVEAQHTKSKYRERMEQYIIRKAECSEHV